MKHMYSPWRNMAKNNVEHKAEKKCTFCNISNNLDKQEHLLYSDEICFIVMNLYPYSSGHVLLIPHKHIISITQLPSKEWLHMSEIMQKATSLLCDSLNTKHLNIGININGYAGASIKDHLHVHLLPRYKGDTNFLTAIFDTRIYSNDFNEVYNKIKQNISKYL